MYSGPGAFLPAGESWYGLPASGGVHLFDWILAAVLVFFTAHRLESRYRALLWFDAAALAVAVPAGVAVALAEGQGWPIILVMGMITGCMGGLLRDVVCNEVPLVLKQGELYATCALAGSLGSTASWPDT